MFFLSIIIRVVFLSSSADLIMQTHAFQLFDELDFTITSVNTTFMKSPTRAPDLYVQVDVAAIDRTDGSLRGSVIPYAETWIHKNTTHAVINETFFQVRYERIRYTFGTDNVILFKIMDQSQGYEDDLLLGLHSLYLNFTRESPHPIGEQIITIVNETLSATSSIGYHLHYLLHVQPVKSDVPDIGTDDYEADVSENPLYHVHRVRHKDGSVEVVLPDYSFSVDLKTAEDLL
jgi:hypothetical protein